MQSNHDVYLLLSTIKEDLQNLNIVIRRSINQDTELQNKSCEYYIYVCLCVNLVVSTYSHLNFKD